MPLTFKTLDFEDQIPIGRHRPHLFVHDHFQMVHRRAQKLHRHRHLVVVSARLLFTGQAACAHLLGLKVCQRGVRLTQQHRHAAQQFTLHGRVHTAIETSGYADADTYRRMSEAVNPYGDGLACERIVKKLGE